MIEYLVLRIILNKLEYSDVILKYPKYEDKINELLINQGYEDLISKQKTKITL